MYHGDVILTTAVSNQYMASKEFHDTIIRWAQEHNAEKIYWEPIEQIRAGGVLCESLRDLMIVGCNVSPEELDARGMLRIGAFDAYIGKCNILPDPKEETGETAETLAQTFKVFIHHFFEVANIAPDMQSKIWDMSLKQFCDSWEETAQADTYQVGRQLSRKQLLIKPRDAICPVCNFKGGLQIVDGIVKCKSCGTTFGDIDEIPN